MLQVPFFICRYLLLNIQVPFSTRQQAIHGTVLFTPALLTPHTAFASLPATEPVFWNVSTHFLYPCAHSVVASSTRCHLNRRKLNAYRETRPPSWENGTWQVPSQLSHSDMETLSALPATFVRVNIELWGSFIAGMGWRTNNSYSIFRRNYAHVMSLLCSTNDAWLNTSKNGMWHSTMDKYAAILFLDGQCDEMGKYFNIIPRESSYARKNVSETALWNIMK